MLLSDVVSRLRAAGCVFAEDEAAILVAAATTPDELADMVARRAAGFPLEQVVGWAGFSGLRIAVDPGVFVPRRRTELLVREALALADPGSVVVDLCCGSGAVGAALLAQDPSLDVYAADIDPAAVACARRNIRNGQVYEGNLYEALPSALHNRVQVLVANVPYVPSGEIELLPAEARVHEPHAALDGGADGLDVLRRVGAGALEWLGAEGCLLSEVSERQVPVAVAALEGCGFGVRVVGDEELGATVVVGSVA